MKLKSFILFFLLPIIAGCSGASDSKTSDADSLAVEELPFPDLPDSIKEPNERANYVVERFWNGMDFADTLRSLNRAFVEQNFSNFISFCPYADKDVMQSSVAKLLKDAEKMPRAYDLLMEVAEKYLYDPESPMLSEELYEVFLQESLKNPDLNAASRFRQQKQMEEVMKNRRGTIAADFEFVTREGSRRSLSSVKSKDKILLIFYDPDCDHCKQVISALRSDEKINNLLNSGDLTILAVYSGSEKEMWKQGSSQLPQNWIVGYEPGTIEEQDLYVLRASPTMYLLDSGRKVLAKDIPLSALL